MGFGQFLGTAAPIVVGSFFGPGGTAAAAGFTGAGTQAAVVSGAITGAGIAALNDEDIGMGAVSGGLGGAAGAGFSPGNMSAANTSATIPSGMTDTAGLQVSTPTFTGPRGGGQFGTMSGSGGFSNASKGLEMTEVTMPNEEGWLSRIGQGSKLTGAGKIGSAGLPALGAASIPDYDANPDDDPMAKYDPNRKLNLGMTTGIQNALTRDSGLRLNQPFAQFADGGYLSPEDTEAYRQYMQQRQLEGSMYKDKTRNMSPEQIEAYRNEFYNMQIPEGFGLGEIQGYNMQIPEGFGFGLPTGAGTAGQEIQGYNMQIPEGFGLGEMRRQAEIQRRQMQGYQDGGYLETGMGDGMSDDIPTSIDGEQPAALSENEFVIPADVVSHIGNGSSDAGAEQLYAMMDRIRKARTGNKEQGREIMPQEYMPA